jgi:hypothetical protein
MFKKIRIFLTFLVLILICLGLVNCDTGIEDSPEPGILRITLESDQTDTTIVFVTDTFTVSDRDTFLIEIFQGKVFRDTSYATLYARRTLNVELTLRYNLLTRANNQYQKLTIFESYVPPLTYDKIRFGMDSYYLKLLGFDKILVQTPPGYFLNLPANIEVKENHVTEVNVRVSPFKNVIRYRDTYIFAPEMEVVDVKIL